jgi:DNA-directed RNA polymerase
MKNTFLKSLRLRICSEIAPQNPLKYLKNVEVEDYIDEVIATVYLYTRTKRGINKTIYLAEVISAIGHRIRTILKQKKNSALAAKTGAFMLYSFEEMGMLEVVLGQSRNNHGQYVIHVLDDEMICELWRSLEPNKIEKLPSEAAYAPWVSTKHETGAFMVKTGNKGVLSTITLKTHPILFDCLNKSQRVGWKINREIFELYAWALRNKTRAFSDIWEQTNPEARQTKLREAKAIGDIAEIFLNKIFYHLYYYDFRGRKYPATAYLHEQGTDLAKGLLLREDKKRIGKKGFFWLLVSIANNWAGDAGREDGVKTDKIPLEERYYWSLDNEEILISYAISPKVNQGWMEADKPWQFLAACIELSKVRLWQGAMKKHTDDEFGYESHLEVYIDGSNNGSQHLSALTKDDITAPHVNLVPLDLPGDLYKYVADHVWERLQKLVDEMTKREIKECETLIDNLIELKKQINEAEPRSDHRKELVEAIKAFKHENSNLMEMASAVFWNRIKDPKHKRKIVKRNVMTLPYGGTPYGLGQQIIDDSKKHGIEQLLYMEHKWGAFMGREVYETCKESLQRPMQLLSVFEQAGRKAESEGRFLEWTVPVTNFPVIQNYTQGRVKKTWVQYGPPTGERISTGYFENTLQLAICFIEDSIPTKRKQAQGASPNAIHSLDAAHLAMTVSQAEFPVTTVHDSFGSLLADMPDLFTLIRKTFVELYEEDPLTSIMNDIDGDISNVQIGTLDLKLILDSEYCFC